MTCPARIKVWKAADGEFQCRLPEEPPHEQHEAPGLYEWQTISWLEGDRRQFTGEFQPCPADIPVCLLPAGHHGNHAS